LFADKPVDYGKLFLLNKSDTVVAEFFSVNPSLPGSSDGQKKHFVPAA
jgi:hypothetical protein